MNENDLCKQMRALRVGIGHDTHRLQPGGPLTIGGIQIPFDSHLVGHSDADVLLHAVTDAILGAASLGDIGEMFPNSDSSNLNRDSINMLRLAWQRAEQTGFQLINLDCVVFAQLPRLSPFKQAIRKKIAAALNLEMDCVGVKAKTGENVGPVGRGEAIQAECVALLLKIKPSSTP